MFMANERGNPSTKSSRAARNRNHSVGRIAASDLLAVWRSLFALC